MRGSLASITGCHAVTVYQGDANPFSPTLNPARRWLRIAARPHVERLRDRLRDTLVARGLAPRVFNGGGTGSLAWCTRESALTEVTATLTIPTAVMNPFFAITNTEAASKTLDIDYFDLLIPGLTR
jgi:hypothetical protein